MGVSSGQDVFYLLVCRECGNGELVMPFGSAEERGKWAAEHTRATGHDRWFVRDETRGAGVPAMTAQEFEAAYAARSGVTVEWLHRHGRYAEPCDCGEDVCEGWAMGHQWEDALIKAELRAETRESPPPG